MVGQFDFVNTKRQVSREKGWTGLSSGKKTDHTRRTGRESRGGKGTRPYKINLDREGNSTSSLQ